MDIFVSHALFYKRFPEDSLLSDTRTCNSAKKKNWYLYQFHLFKIFSNSFVNISTNKVENQCLLPSLAGIRKFHDNPSID
jgi:hypothetical protein